MGGNGDDFSMWEVLTGRSFLAPSFCPVHVCHPCPLPAFLSVVLQGHWYCSRTFENSLRSNGKSEFSLVITLIPPFGPLLSIYLRKMRM